MTESSAAQAEMPALSLILAGNRPLLAQYESGGKNIIKYLTANWVEPKQINERIWELEYKCPVNLR